MSDNRLARIARFAAVALVVLVLAATHPSSAQTGAPEPRQLPMNPATGESPGVPI